MKVFSFFVRVCLSRATVVHLSPISGAVVNVGAGGVQTIAALRFDSAISEFWNKADCPLAVSSVPAGRVAVVLENSGGAARVSVAEKPFAGEQSDVAGYLGIGPTSEFARDRLLTFRKKGDVVSLELNKARFGSSTANLRLGESALPRLA